jgi:hypothetical protein
MAAGGVARRALPKVLVLVLAVAAAADLLLFGMGLLEASSFRDLGIAAGLVIASALAWEVAERCGGRGGMAGASAWAAFPLSIGLAAASLPFLLGSVYPPLWNFLAGRGRVEARLAEGGASLEIHFPEAVAADGLHLEIDGIELSGEFTAQHAEAFRWPGSRTLEVDLARVRAALPAVGKPAHVTINSGPARTRFRYTDGQVLPRQRVMVR